MKTNFVRVKWLRSLGNISYMLGVAFLIASLVVNAIPAAPAFASGGSDCSHENTDGDDEFCVDDTGQSGSWDAPAGYIIVGFVIKAGTEDFGAVPGCYEVNQSETSVSWNRVGDGSECKEISHVEIYYKWVPSTPTNTPVTPTNTNTPVNTETPTNTPVVTETPTNTPEVTNTPVVTETPDEKKVTICHAAGQDYTEKFVVLTLSVNAAFNDNAGHFNEDGTPRAGHEDDFVIESEEDLARCTPPATPTPETTNTPEVTNTPVVTETPTNTPVPTETPVVDPFDINFYCTGFTIINKNNEEGRFEWAISNGPSGTGTVPANGSVSFDTDYYAGVVTVNFNGDLSDAGYLPTNCGGDETPEKTPEKTPVTVVTKNPAPQVTPVIIPVTGSPEVLIPVTGADVNAGLPLNAIFFSLSIGFIGLGLVLNGAARERKDWDF